jgi:hypothetical protein
MDKRTQFDKARYSLYSAVVFFLLASPFGTKIVDRLLGSSLRIVNYSGHAKFTGLLIQSILFGIIVFGLMQIKKI